MSELSAIGQIQLELLLLWTEFGTTEQSAQALVRLFGKEAAVKIATELLQLCQADGVKI